MRGREASCGAPFGISGNRDSMSLCGDEPIVAQNKFAGAVLPQRVGRCGNSFALRFRPICLSPPNSELVPTDVRALKSSSALPAVGACAISLSNRVCDVLIVIEAELQEGEY